MNLMNLADVIRDIKRADLRQMYYYLRLTRALEDRITALYRQGRIVGGVYTSHGMEAIAVGYASALETDDLAQVAAWLDAPPLDGSRFARLLTRAARSDDLPRPSIRPVEVKTRLMQHFAPAAGIR